MDLTDDFLKRIVEAEYAARKGLNKIFLEFSIEKTSSFKPLKSQPTRTSREFTPSTIASLISLFFILFLFLSMSYTLLFSGKKSLPVAVTWLFLIFFLSVIIVLIKSTFFDPPKKIVVDHSGITINEVSYKWSEIHSTGILSSTKGENGTQYLVIGLADMRNYEKYELSDFNRFFRNNIERELSVCIEYFKPDNTQ